MQQGSGTQHENRSGALGTRPHSEKASSGGNSDFERREPKLIMVLGFPAQKQFPRKGFPQS